jgi:hypothetical protein
MLKLIIRLPPSSAYPAAWWADVEPLMVGQISLHDALATGVQLWQGTILENKVGSSLYMCPLLCFDDLRLILFLFFLFFSCSFRLSFHKDWFGHLSVVVVVIILILLPFPLLLRIYHPLISTVRQPVYADPDGVRLVLLWRQRCQVSDNLNIQRLSITFLPGTCRRRC